MTLSNKRPLVFVHGFMGGSEQWELQKPLGDERELVCLDLPGFGLRAAEAAKSSIPEFAAWALEALTAKGIKDFDLIGHSMGGMIVQEMVRQSADAERVRNLILYATGSIGEMPGRFETIETSIERALHDGPQATARRISATWFLDYEQAREYPTCAAIAEKAPIESIQAGLRAMQAWNGQDYLSQIQVPTLILWGDQDRAYLWPQIDLLWRSIPKAQLAVVPKASHAVHLEEPQIFELLVRKFLD